MAKKPKAYVAALPLSALPELRELLGRFCSPEGARGNVVMMRLGDKALARLDELVEAGMFGSRSEAAAFLVGAGIEAQKELFKRISRHSTEIRKLRQSLRQAAVGGSSFLDSSSRFTGKTLNRRLRCWKERCFGF